jgi:hypothetical protein
MLVPMLGPILIPQDLITVSDRSFCLSLFPCAVAPQWLVVVFLDIDQQLDLAH